MCCHSLYFSDCVRHVTMDYLKLLKKMPLSAWILYAAACNYRELEVTVENYAKG